MWEWLRRTSTDERVGEGFVGAEELLPGLEQAERLRGIDAEGLERVGGQHLAHSALEGEAAVSIPRPGGLTATLGAQIQQASVLCVEELGIHIGSRGRRRGAGCTPGTDARGSGAPAAPRGFPAVARRQRSAAPT